MSKAFHITQWNPLYEKAETRKTDYMSWYPKQTKMVGLGIGKTMAQSFPQNMILRGLWGEIETLASLSRVQERGWLIRNGAALDAEMMNSLMPTVPATAFQQALDWFSHPAVGWLELVDCPFISQSVPIRKESTGKISQSVPIRKESTGGNSATERERERELTDRGERKEREALTDACRRVSAPSPEEVETWASGAGIPPPFALAKLAEALEREDFAKAIVRKNWQARFTRFWKEDGTTWTRKMQKNAAVPNGSGGGRPDGWMEGDLDLWWTAELSTLRAMLSGLAMTDKKNAARVHDILRCREGGK